MAPVFGTTSCRLSKRGLLCLLITIIFGTSRAHVLPQTRQTKSAGFEVTNMSSPHAGSSYPGALKLTDVVSEVMEASAKLLPATQDYVVLSHGRYLAHTGTYGGQQGDSLGVLTGSPIQQRTSGERLGQIRLAGLAVSTLLELDAVREHIGRDTSMADAVSFMATRTEAQLTDLLTQLVRRMDVRDNSGDKALSLDLVAREKRFIGYWAAAVWLFKVLGVTNALASVACQVQVYNTGRTFVSTEVCNGMTTVALLTAFGVAIYNFAGQASAAAVAAATAVADADAEYELTASGNLAGISGGWKRGVLDTRRHPPRSAAMGLWDRNGKNLTAADYYDSTATSPINHWTRVAGTKVALRTWREEHPNIEGGMYFVTATGHIEGDGRRVMPRCLDDSGHTYDVCSNNLYIGIQAQDQGSGPQYAYFGWDLYNNNQDRAESWDMGEGNGGYNGEAQFMEDIENNVGSQVWDSCVCTEENGQWVSTGALQWSWDATYNGYSQCWNSGCDGA